MELLTAATDVLFLAAIWIENGKILAKILIHRFIILGRQSSRENIKSCYFWIFMGTQRRGLVSCTDALEQNLLMLPKNYLICYREEWIILAITHVISQFLKLKKELLAFHSGEAVYNIVIPMKFLSVGLKRKGGILTLKTFINLAHSWVKIYATTFIVEYYNYK